MSDGTQGGMRAIHLHGSAISDGLQKLCEGKCKQTRNPEGGVQMNPSKWICAGCWKSWSLRK